MPEAKDLPAEIQHQIFKHAARTDGRTAVTLSTVAKWVRTSVQPSLDTHMRVLHISEHRMQFFLRRFEQEEGLEKNVRALAIDHTSINIYDDALDVTVDQLPDPDDIEFVIQVCSGARLVFIETSALHAFSQARETFANTDALTICSAHLPPLEREWSHLPYPPASTAALPAKRLHLCPLGADTLRHIPVMSPLAPETTHLAITCPILAGSDVLRIPAHEFLSRHVVLPLLESETFERLIFRGSPQILLRICKGLHGPPQPFPFEVAFGDEVVDHLHDPNNTLDTQRIRFRLWPAPNADPALLASQFEGRLVYPALMREWRDAANAQLDAEDAHEAEKAANPDFAQPSTSSRTDNAEDAMDVDGDGEEPVDSFRPPFGAPWDDDEGDLCGVSQATIDQLQRLVEQYPQYPGPPPSRPYGRIFTPAGLLPAPPQDG